MSTDKPIYKATNQFLNHENHYDFQASKIKQFKIHPVNPSNFHSWTKQNMYRTSYINHYTQKPADPKNVVIPGYQGYVPYIHAENKFGKGSTALSRDSFNQQKLGRNKHELATTGFNLMKSALIDQSKKASSSKYGKTQIQLSHPAWIPEKLVSTTHDAFIPPKSRLNPTFRTTEPHLQTQKPDSKTSGYSQNYAFLDGTGWNPHPILNGDRNRSEYRDRFNQAINYHRNVETIKSRTLPKLSLNYEYNY